MAEPPPERVIANARGSLQPHTLAPIPRLALLDKAFAHKRRREETSTTGRQALVITGEGGMGKSVMLGQLLDACDTGEQHPDRPAGLFSGGAVLVSCADVTLGSTRPDQDEVDAALGRAAGAVGRRRGVVSVLENLKAEHGSVALLLDTLDLLIGPETLPGLAAVIADALEVGEVIMTCRAEEYRSYLDGAAESAPRLANRLTQAPLPKLAAEDIVRWARHYLEGPHRRHSGEEEAFLDALEAGLWRSGSMWEVCSVPVRLALTCEVFAEGGHLPEDLTVTGLYDAYWHARVSKRAGSRSRDGDAKCDAALAVASHLLNDSGQLVLRVPMGDLGPNLLPGLRMLASEGVLTELTTAWEFFHQTFAEYASARWMLTLGPTSDRINQLGAHLRGGHTNLWAIAGSLLLQADGYDDYVALTECLALEGPEGAKMHMVAALRQPNPAALVRVVDRIRAQPNLWPAVLPELGNAPRDITAVPDVILAALRQDPSRVAGPATAALVALLSRTRPEDSAALLAAALRALTEVRVHVPASALDHHVAKLIQTQIKPVQDSILAVLCDHYPHLGPRGRQAVVRVHLTNAPSLTDDQTMALGRAALAAPCPPLDDQEAERLVRLFWDCSSLRLERGWHTWREVLADDLPAGTWHNATVRFIADLASSDEAVRTQLVDDLLDGHVRSPTAHVNAFEHVAARQCAWVADRLLGRTVPDNANAVGAITSAAAALAHGLPSAIALDLMHWLTPCRVLSPRQVWPAQITLAGRSANIQRQIFDELVAAGEPQPVLDSAVDAWLFRTTGHVLDDLTPQLRVLLQSADADILQTRARLEGRRAEHDPDARAWVTEKVLAGHSPRIAGTAIKTITEVIAEAGGPVQKPFADWLAGLLVTPHTDAARRILVLLHDPKVVDDATYASMFPDLLIPLMDRLDQAVRRHEDSQLVQALLDCFIRAERLAPMNPDLVRHIYDALAQRLPKAGGTPGVSSDAAATAVRNVTKLCGTLMARCLPAAEVRERIGSLLTSFDPGDIANKSVRSVGSMLVGIGRRDPEALDWMEDLFGTHITALGVKMAIAEAFVEHDRHRAGGRASRLKDRADCPPEVVTYVINKLQT